MARITTDVGSRESELVPNEIHEQHARLDRARKRPAVHGGRDCVSAVFGANALAFRTCLLSLRGHPNHLPARAVAVSSARRVNTSIIARLYSSLPRRSDVGCASPDAILRRPRTPWAPPFSRRVPSPLPERESASARPMQERLGPPPHSASHLGRAGPQPRLSQSLRSSV